MENKFKKIKALFLDNNIIISINNNIISLKSNNTEWETFKKELAEFNGILDSDTDSSSIEHKFKSIKEFIIEKSQTVNTTKEGYSLKHILNLLRIENLETEEYKTLKIEFLEALKKSNYDHLFKEINENVVFLYTTTIIPPIFMKAFIDAEKNNLYSKISLINFWKNLCANPNKQIRYDAFKWIYTSKFAITNSGNLITYRNVDNDREYNKNILKITVQVFEKVIQLTRRQEDIYKYNIYKNGDEIIIAKTSEFPMIATLQEEYDNLISTNNCSLIPRFHAQHQGAYGQDITLGIPVTMPRDKCDMDANSSCSKGLHQKSLEYGLNLGDTVLVCLVNPYDIVAIPTNDCTKMRTCRYLPFGIAEKDKAGNIIPWEEGTYNFPKNILNKLEVAISFDNSDRFIDELKEYNVISKDLTKEFFNINVTQTRKYYDDRS